MTAVLFKFQKPDGTPVADAPFTVTLRKPSFDEDLNTGILVPGDIQGLTDAQGECTLMLAAGYGIYYLQMHKPGDELDAEGCMQGLRYKFVVPDSVEVVRVEDLIVTNPTWSRPWDEMALAQITEAKTVSVAAAEAAEAAKVIAVESAEIAQGAIQATIDNAAAADISAKAAAASELAAGLSATRAETAEAIAVASADRAEASELVVKENAAEAAGYRDAAAQSAELAATHKDAAATSAGESKADALASEASRLASGDSATASALSAGEAAASVGAAQEAAAEASTAKDAAEAALASLEPQMAELGDLSLASGTYPPKPLTAAIWRISVGGSVGGVVFTVGNALVYSKVGDMFYRLGSNEDSGGGSGVLTVNGRDGDVVLVKADVGLPLADNTSDVQKPISTAQQAALDLKVPKEPGKGLSSQDFTQGYKNTLDGLPAALADKVDVVAGKVLSSEDFTSVEKVKLAAIAAGATANQSDTFLRDRANHTGTQLASTISDMAAAVRLVTLSGLVLENAAITSADSILVALGRAQGQINQKLSTTAKAADSSLLNGQDAAFYTKILSGATATVPGTPGWVPAPAAGDQLKFLCADGTWKTVPGGSGGSGQPVGGLVIWDISEATLPAGYIPRNGQLVTRAMWPDLWALVSATAITDANWIANPLSRGKFSSGDGSTTFRMPDLNGKYSDGLTPAAFLRGYGFRSAGEAGLMQVDQMQDWDLTFSFNDSGSLATFSAAGASFSKGTVRKFEAVTATKIAGTAGTPRFGLETRPFSSSVIWCCIGGTTAVNPGTVDIVATAAQVAAQASRIQNLEANSQASTIVYPNGGTEAAPATAQINSRYLVPNPFPGFYVMCFAQIRVSGNWGNPEFVGTGTGTSIGVRANLFGSNIVVQTGTGFVGTSSNQTGDPFGISGSNTAPSPVRVIVVKTGLVM